MIDLVHRDHPILHPVQQEASIHYSDFVSVLHSSFPLLPSASLNLLTDVQALAFQLPSFPF
jgi:hypothetical protein